MNLALVLADQGRFPDAEALNRETLQQLVRVLGPEHPFTLNTMNNLADVLISEGKYPEAEKLNREALASRERLLGPEHADTIISMANLARLLASDGRAREAEDLIARVLEMRKKVLGPEHPDTITTMADLAAVLGMEKKYAEAETVGRDALEIGRRVLGDKDPTMGILLYNLGAVAGDSKSDGRSDHAVESSHRCGVTSRGRTEHRAGPRSHTPAGQPPVSGTRGSRTRGRQGEQQGWIAPMAHRIRNSVIACAIVLATTALTAQLAPSLDDALRAIFEREEFEAQSIGSIEWLDGGQRYTAMRPRTRDLVAYDTATGAEQVLAPASALVLPGSKEPMAVDEYAWSSDKSKLLVFTNTRKVWRTNARGDYWVLTLGAGTPGALKKLGGDAPEASVMYAKFSPDGTRVAYVRAQNLYVEDLGSGRILPLTKDGGGDIVNGTGDWVNEEEFSIYDGFKWSPDGRRIAFWQFDTSGVERFTLINNTAELYPRVIPFPYPKPGTKNSAVRVGIVASDGGAAVWVKSAEPLRDHYIPRMEWADERTLVLQNMNRLQNRNDVMLADVTSGDARRILRDEGRGWVEHMDEVAWLYGGREFVWVSEKDGWRHAFAVKRDGSGKRLMTKLDGDSPRSPRSTRPAGNLYFIASPANATQRYLYAATTRRRRNRAARHANRTSPARTATTFHRTDAGRCTRGRRFKAHPGPRSSHFQSIDPCGCWSTTRSSPAKQHPSSTLQSSS